MVEAGVEDANLPAFFELLSPEDREGYRSLRAELSSSDRKFKRYKRLTSFQDALTAIRTYCVKGNSDDWKRSLVCGVCWMGFDIGINTRQLRLLINKCKSSINGALAKMGYGSTPIVGDGSRALVNAIPFLKGNFVEQRLWTIRKRVIPSPAPMMAGAVFPGAYSGLNFIATPQPVAPADFVDPTFGRSEIAAVFGVNVQQESQEPQPDEEMRQYYCSTELCFDKKVNFFQDPLCCCPFEWQQDDDTGTEKLFAYG